MILGGIARAGFSHRESALPDPINIRTVDQRKRKTKRETENNKTKATNNKHKKKTSQSS